MTFWAKRTSAQNLHCIQFCKCADLKFQAHYKSEYYLLGFFRDQLDVVEHTLTNILIRISIQRTFWPELVSPWGSHHIKSLKLDILGDSGWKCLQAGRRFYSIFYNPRENNGQTLLRQNAPRLYNRYNHRPWARSAYWPSPGPGPISSTPKQWQSDVHFKFKTL